MRIAELCKFVETRGSDPFEVDVKKHLETLGRYLPEWEELKELVLDSEALNRLTSIIRLQSDWIKYRTSPMYIDPLLVELKIRVAKPNQLAECLAESWHPAVALQQLSPERLLEGTNYWNSLLPLAERHGGDLVGEGAGTSVLEPESLIKMGFMASEEFNRRMKSLWSELKQKETGRRELPYWDFVSSHEFSETVMRAYLLAFLASEGLAHIAVDPLEDKITVSASEEYVSPKTKGTPRSLVIPLNVDSFSRRKEV